MNLLLDEMWTRAVAVQLRARGYDVEAVDERLGLRKLSDAELLAVAHSEGRALVTEDLRDFRRIARTWRDHGRDHSGILYAPPGRFPRAGGRGIGALIEALQAVIEEGFDQRNLEHWLR